MLSYARQQQQKKTHPNRKETVIGGQVVTAPRGASNRWNGIGNGTMEWKMECNIECTQLQLTCVTGAAQLS